MTDSGTYNGTNSVVGQRRAIADLTGRTRTTVYVHAATGSNTVPTLTGMTEAAARAAIIAAGFTVGAVTQTADSGVTGVSTQATTGVAAVGTAIAFTVNTQTIG